jgi:hypothetical protein
MASLADAQLRSEITRDGIAHCWGLEEWDLLITQPWPPTVRPWLRFLAELPRAKQDLALSPNGLPFASLSGKEQHAFLTAGKGRLVNEDFLSAQQTAAQWRLRVEYAPAGLVWAPAPSASAGRREQDEAAGLPLVYGRDAGEVLAAARRLRPDAAAGQIVPTTGLLLVRILTADGKSFPVGGNRPLLIQPDGQ